MVALALTLVGCAQATPDKELPTAPPDPVAVRSQLLVARTAYRDLVLGDNPTGYWRLGDQGTTTALDSSTGAHNGTYSKLTPGAQLPWLAQLGAILTDGDTAAYFHIHNIHGQTPITNYNWVEVPSTPSLNSPHISVEAWVNMNQTSIPQTYASIAMKGTGVFESGYGFYLWDNRLWFYVNSRMWRVGVPVWRHEFATYRHVVGTYDGAWARIYLDGKLAAEAQLPANANLASDAPFTIGKGAYLGWSGHIDEVATYNYALPLEKIKAHYDTGSIVPQATPAWNFPTAPSSRLAGGAVTTNGAVLSHSERSVVAISSTGGPDIVDEYPDRRRFDIDPTGARYGVYTNSGFEVHQASGALVATYPRQPEGYAQLVPNTDLAFIPEQQGGREAPRPTHARFFQPSGLRSRFAAPHLLISRLTSTHLVYATATHLIRTTIDGAETWRVPLVLRTFEIASNGSRLIGVQPGSGSSNIVHVNLENGAVSAPMALQGSFWDIAISPSGQHSVATTKNAAYVFGAGVYLRRVDLPLDYTVSASISDDGYAAFGGQLASHEARILLLGPTGRGLTTITRPVELDGYRPHVRFSASGQRVISNESGGLFAYDVPRAP